MRRLSIVFYGILMILMVQGCAVYPPGYAYPAYGYGSHHYGHHGWHRGGYDWDRGRGWGGHHHH